MIECMIDLETFGLPPNGLPISIGAVKFDVETLTITDRLHVCIDPETVGDMPYGAAFSINPGTVKWWLDPARDEARASWFNSPKVDLPTAMVAFLEWFGIKSMPVWGNAVTFDIVLMKHALTALSLRVPWKFYDERCHRTIKSLPPEAVSKDAFKLGIDRAEPGVLHTALFDAEVQAWQNMLLRPQSQRSGTYDNGMLP